ncbi:N-acetylglutaminylglutamine amidotransferase [Thiomicrorhabdus xiamenensis]|uniref:asparagine synthase (glutamine-hydrolyzing) n=1 Tax=Thiomicrorhabdus xiamenensis TaxID=2739063 RepID=A0A7D4T0D8_9GAMM|nr:N-acetylglutaminylglutamine amidotransferase [Thiomicrorhabdus xiamenensis]QKI88745.1 N-acetylglutaminylglutamine amidotransferase [Thiomicrorhabdus xiamenensis]
MCGICGEIYFDGQQASEQRLKPMLAAMQNRGPDDEGIWIDEHVGLGHKRLSIIDLSACGHQPMLDKELSLVFNGCIYNYVELREQLTELGHEFVSHSDTEVILKAYRQWGMECVQYFEGMFAFAIWDDDHHQLLLARDRMGIKPLYYAPVEGGVRFASNTQALLAEGDIDSEIDPVGLHFQLTLHAVIPAPYTILKGIRKLEPGHWMIVNPDGQIFKKRYWHLEAKRPTGETFKGEAVPQSEQEWVDAIHKQLKQAVHKRLTAADVPVGVLLSGGLDSSLLVAMLAEAGVENIKTYSIGFEDAPEEKGNEFEFSDMVAERYKTDHKKFHIPNETVLPRLHEAVESMAEPMVGQDAVAFYLLSEQVSKEVKVVLSGQGADEVFGGYFWYPLMADAGKKIDLKDRDQALQCFAPYYFDRSHEEWLEVINPQYHVHNVTGEYVADHLTEEGADEFLDQVLRLDVTTLIVDDPVKRVDNMTMAWSLEARVPFLDHDLVEWAMAAPPQMKTGGKHILKAIGRGIVPDEIIDRPKVAFPMPALKYVRGDFYEFMKSLLTSEAAKKRGIFNQQKLAELLENPEADNAFTAIQGSKLWHAALLEFWLQKHVDKTL